MPKRSSLKAALWGPKQQGPSILWRCGLIQSQHLEHLEVRLGALIKWPSLGQAWGLLHIPNTGMASCLLSSQGSHDLCGRSAPSMTQHPGAGHGSAPTRLTFTTSLPFALTLYLKKGHVPFNLEQKPYTLLFYFYLFLCRAVQLNGF